MFRSLIIHYFNIIIALKNLYIVDNTTICLNTVLSLGGRSDSLFGFEMLSTVVIILESSAGLNPLNHLEITTRQINQIVKSANG